MQQVDRDGQTQEYIQKSFDEISQKLYGQQQQYEEVSQKYQLTKYLSCNHTDLKKANHAGRHFDQKARSEILEQVKRVDTGSIASEDCKVKQAEGEQEVGVQNCL